MTRDDWIVCDACDRAKPCVVTVWSTSGETAQCHACRQLPDCDECHDAGFDDKETTDEQHERDQREHD